MAAKSKTGRRVIEIAALALTIATLYCGESWAQLKDETLVATIPTGFKIGSQSNHDRTTTLQWVKESETAQNWTEMVTVQVDRAKSARSPHQLLESTSKKWQSACKGAVANEILDGQVNGYAVSMLLLRCPLVVATGKPEITMFRVIKGNDALYSIQKTFRFEPSKEQLGQIMKYLSSVNVCDARGTEHPCPKVD
ncbi:MAG TPA: hypothetical protein VII70_02360 [Steroidobacteraceae bacterium]